MKRIILLGLFPLAIILALMASLVGTLVAPAYAAALTVESGTDDGTSVPGNCPGAGCRLRDAMAAAAPGDTITFAGDYTISFASQLTISQNVTIDGAGHTVTISGNHAVRVFYVNSGVTFNLQNLTVANGSVSSGYGAGLHNEGGTVTVANSAFSGNNADSGGGIYNSGAMTVTNSTLSGNSARVGAAIANESGATLTVQGSTLSGNTASGAGGGFKNGGTLIVRNSTISGNSANWNGPDGGGGALDQWGPTPTSASAAFTNTTIAGNSAANGHEGLLVRNGSVTLRNSLVVGNGSANCWMDVGVSFSGAADDLADDASCTGFTQVGDALLGALGNYGGTTSTHALLPGSPAIDAGNDATCLAPDQRGVARPAGARCDIGAFESRSFTLSKTGGDNQTTPINTPFAQLLALSVTSAFGEPVNGGTVTFTAPSSGASTNPATNIATIAAGGGAVSQSVTANGTLGSYTVTASANGATSVVFNLQNTQVVYAIPGGATSGSCRSWGQACELSYALAQSVSGQEIWAAAGTYKPSGTDRNATFQLKDGAAIYGGFVGAITETLRTQRNPTTNVVTLSGDIGTIGNNSDNSFHMVKGASGATLDGVTVSGGNANGSGSNSYDRGGGMYNYSSGPTLANVTLSGNSAQVGGGMCNTSSSPTLTNVTFSGDSAGNGGGGMYNNSSNPTLTNVTFSGNTATTNGGGMYNTSSSNPIIRNSIFWDASGGEIVKYDSTPTVSDSVVQGGYAGGTNIITADPLLGALGNYGGSTQTIPLQSSSSAIDAGNPTYCPTTDQRGQARADLRCDAGAYELEYTNSHTVMLPVSSASLTTFGATLLGLRRDAGFTDSGNITVVKHGWQTQGIEAIGATWIITPTTSTGFSLTLQLCFTPLELGGLNENDLRFWRYSDDAWMQVGGAPTLSTVNGIRCATLTGVTALSAWTLATSHPTAVTLSGLSAHSDALHPATSPASVLVVALLVVSLIGSFMNTRRRSMNTARLLRNIIVISVLFNVAGCSPAYGGKADSTGAPAPALLNVVDVRQETPYTCGVACAQAILNYYGIDQRQDRLAEQFGTTEDAGTSPKQIVAGLESYGLTTTLKEQTTLEDLRINIQNQIPTMVAIQAWLETYPAPDWSKNWEDGHWVIVLGVDDQNVYFEDPSLLGTRGVLTQEEFLARWHDYAGDAPCCDANDYLWQHLSISVKGNAVKTPPFTLIQ